MFCLQSLRQARWITRLVLVWFALFVGAAIASPIVKPTSSQIVCSAMGGMKMVMDDEGQTQAISASMDCPLCAPMAAPGPALRAETSCGSQACALHPRKVARLVNRIDPPWLARAPPQI